MEVLPTFPYDEKDCPDGDRQQCGKEALEAYLLAHVYYPQEALRKNIEGIASVRITIEPDGTLTDLSLVLDPGAGIGDEALRVVKEMSKNLRWLPGVKNGEIVSTRGYLPIKFRTGVFKEVRDLYGNVVVAVPMTDDVPPPPPPPPLPMGPMEEEVYMVAEVMPTFAYDPDSCSLSSEEACGQAALEVYLKQQVKYRKEAHVAKLHGWVTIDFVVDSNGQISRVRLVRDPGLGVGEELLRVFREMNEQGIRWKPGTQGGTPARVRQFYTKRVSLTGG